MARIVIVGAGLTGLSAAYHLEQKQFYDYVLLEKQNAIGGLCGSLEQDGFTFDYTGHLLHINDPYFASFIQKNVGFDFFNQINRRSHIHSYNCTTPYPYQINLKGLPPHIIIDCIEGFVKRGQYKKKRTFRDWVLHTFGQGFAKHFFVPYQEKIFSIGVDDITASWTSRFVPATTLSDILHGTLVDPKNDAGYNAQFYYPKRGGIVSWLYKIADQLSQPISTDCSVAAIDTQKKVIYTHDQQAIAYDTLISTMPLDRLLACIIETPTMDCKKAINKLRCNSVFNFNLGIAKQNLCDSHWVYYPEKKYPFYRVGFPYNLSAHMTPSGCSSLSGEIGFMGSPQALVHEAYKRARNLLKRQLTFSEHDIVTEKLITVSHAFVTYDFWREKNLSSLLHQLKQASIYSVGRYGAWKYASMQEAVLDGKTVADTVIHIPARSYTQPYMHTAQKPYRKPKQKEYS